MNKENVQRLIDEGKTKQEIAELLGVLVKTLDMFLNAHELSVDVPVEADEDEADTMGIDDDADAQNERESDVPPKVYGKNAFIKLDEPEIVRLYVDAEFTQQELGRIYGVSAWKIAQVLRRKRVKMRRRMPSIRITRDEMEQMYKEDGMTRQQIADALGVSLQVVDVFMRKNHIVLEEKRGRPRGEHKGRDKEEFEELLDEYKSVPMLAEHYGIEKQTVYYYINKFGLREKYESMYQRKRRSSNV